MTRAVPRDDSITARERDPGELVIAAFDATSTIDPHAAFDSGSRHVVLNVYESPLRFDEETGGFVPWLAESVERSADGRRYTLRMRPGVRDHRGRVVTARDAEYSIRRAVITAAGPGSLWVTALLGPGNADPDDPAAALEACRRVEAAGDELRVELAEPFAPFQAVVANWALVLSRDWAVAEGAWPGELDAIEPWWRPERERLLASANGTGPYALERVGPSPGPFASFRRHEAHWRPLSSPRRVTLTAIQDRVERECALLEGRADYAVCQPESLARLAGADHVVVRQTPDEWHVNPLGILTYRLAPDAPAAAAFPREGLADRHLRRALSLAFDYERFTADALDGDPIAHPGPFPAPALPDAPAPEHRFDLDAAAAELRRAWDGTAADRGFELAVYTHRDNYAREAAAAILADGFNRLSPRCRMKVVALPFDELIAETFAGRCPVAWLSWDADYLHPHAFAHELLSSTALLPRSTGMRLSGSDDLLRAALDSPPQEALAIYRRLARAAIDDCSYLFVPGKVSYLNHSAHWRGVRLFPGASNVLDFASFVPADGA